MTQPRLRRISITALPQVPVVDLLSDDEKLPESLTPEPPLLRASSREPSPRPTAPPRPSTPKKNPSSSPPQSPSSSSSSFLDEEPLHHVAVKLRKAREELRTPPRRRKRKRQRHRHRRYDIDADEEPSSSSSAATEFPRPRPRVEEDADDEEHYAPAHHRTLSTMPHPQMPTMSAPLRNGDTTDSDVVPVSAATLRAPSTSPHRTLFDSFPDSENQPRSAPPNDSPRVGTLDSPGKVILVDSPPARVSAYDAPTASSPIALRGSANATPAVSLPDIRGHGRADPEEDADLRGGRAVAGEEGNENDSSEQDGIMKGLPDEAKEGETVGDGLAAEDDQGPGVREKASQVDNVTSDNYHFELRRRFEEGGYFEIDEGDKDQQDAGRQEEYEIEEDDDELLRELYDGEEGKALDIDPENQSQENEDFMGGDGSVFVEEIEFVEAIDDPASPPSIGNDSHDEKHRTRTHGELAIRQNEIRDEFVAFEPGLEKPQGVRETKKPTAELDAAEEGIRSIVQQGDNVESMSADVEGGRCKSEQPHQASGTSGGEQQVDVVKKHLGNSERSDDAQECGRNEHGHGLDRLEDCKATVSQKRNDGNCNEGDSQGRKKDASRQGLQHSSREAHNTAERLKGKQNICRYSGDDEDQHSGNQHGAQSKEHCPKDSEESHSGMGDKPIQSHCGLQDEKEQTCANAQADRSPRLNEEPVVRKTEESNLKATIRKTAGEQQFGFSLSRSQGVVPDSDHIGNMQEESPGEGTESATATPAANTAVPVRSPALSPSSLARWTLSPRPQQEEEKEELGVDEHLLSTPRERVPLSPLILNEKSPCRQLAPPDEVDVLESPVGDDPAHTTGSRLPLPLARFPEKGKAPLPPQISEEITGRDAMKGRKQSSASLIPPWKRLREKAREEAAAWQGELWPEAEHVYHHFAMHQGQDIEYEFPDTGEETLRHALRRVAIMLGATPRTVTQTIGCHVQLTRAADATRFPASLKEFRTGFEKMMGDVFLAKHFKRALESVRRGVENRSLASLKRKLRPPHLQSTQQRQSAVSRTVAQAQGHSSSGKGGSRGAANLQVNSSKGLSQLQRQKPSLPQTHEKPGSTPLRRVRIVEPFSERQAGAPMQLSAGSSILAQFQNTLTERQRTALPLPLRPSHIRSPQLGRTTSGLPIRNTEKTAEATFQNARKAAGVQRKLLPMNVGGHGPGTARSGPSRVPSFFANTVDTGVSAPQGEAISRNREPCLTVAEGNLATRQSCAAREGLNICRDGHSPGNEGRRHDTRASKRRRDPDVRHLAAKDGTDRSEKRLKRRRREKNGGPPTDQRDDGRLERNVEAQTRKHKEQLRYEAYQRRYENTQLREDLPAMLHYQDITARQPAKTSNHRAHRQEKSPDFRWRERSYIGGAQSSRQIYSRVDRNPNHFRREDDGRKYARSRPDYPRENVVTNAEDAAPIGRSNRGFAILHKLGWREGEGLGVDKSGITTPLQPAQSGRRGIGA